MNVSSCTCVFHVMTVYIHCVFLCLCVCVCVCVCVCGVRLVTCEEGIVEENEG